MRRTLMSQKRQYWQLTKNTLGSRLIAYCPEWNPSGTIDSDISGNNRNGAYTRSTLGQLGIGDGRTSVAFPGNGFSDIYSTSFNNAFSGNEFSISIWLKNSNWRDASIGYPLAFSMDGSNWIFIEKNGGQIDYQRKASGVNKTLTIPIIDTPYFTFITITASKSGDIQRLMWNGIEYANVGTLSNLTVPISANYCTIGANNNTGASGFVGNAAHVSVANAPITLAEHRKLFSPKSTVSFIGDSITAWTSGATWAARFVGNYLGGRVVAQNHAVASMGILTGASNMAAQIISAANDNANKLIIAIGTNDDNSAGNLSALQTAYQNGIDAFRASNPSASVFALNVLPKWTNNTGSTPIDTSNIKTAISNACTAKGVPCPDTTGVIVAADTTDGTHLGPTGITKVYNFVMANFI
jgi:lysophospholipase L1-like esterase